jgi:hypothetical protein
MAEQNNHNNNTDNNTDNENSPIQQQTFFEGVLDYVTTLNRNQQQEQQQPIRNLPTDLFNEPKPIEEENEDEDLQDPEEPRTMPTTTYSLGGMSLEFDSDKPAQNTDYDVGVVISKANRFNTMSSSNNYYSNHTHGVIIYKYSYS